MKRTPMPTVAAVLLSSAANAQSSCAPIGGLIGGLVNGLNQKCQVERQQARSFEAQLICTRAGFPPNHPPTARPTYFYGIWHCASSHSTA
jgi:hypothetical protein